MIVPVLVSVLSFSAFAVLALSVLALSVLALAVLALARFCRLCIIAQLSYCILKFLDGSFGRVELYIYALLVERDLEILHSLFERDVLLYLVDAAVAVEIARKSNLLKLFLLSRCINRCK